MKILLFTHEQDIDGLGCAILANFSNLEYDLVLSKTFELDEKMLNEFKKDSINSYDMIIVTDLCPNKDILELINSNPSLSKRVQVLDHHKTAEQFNTYDFVKIVSENN